MLFYLTHINTTVHGPSPTLLTARLTMSLLQVSLPTNTNLHALGAHAPTNSNMSDNQSSGLLNMPMELRLDVYRLLLEDCLANGTVSDIAGLYLACAQLHQELEAEYASKLRPLLHAHYEWAVTGPQEDMLRIGVEPKLNVDVGQAQVSVLIPIGIDDEVTPRAAASSLRHVLGSRCATLALGYIDTNPSRQAWPDLHTELRSFWLFFRDMGRPNRCEYQNFDQIERLILSTGRCDLRVAHEQFDDMWEFFLFVRSYLIQKTTPQRIMRAWISRPCTGNVQGWRLTLDLASKLNLVEDALWVIESSNRLLKARRLFTEMEEVNGNNLFEEEIDLDDRMDSFDTYYKDFIDFDTDDESEVGSRRSGKTDVEVFDEFNLVNDADMDVEDETRSEEEWMTEDDEADNDSE